MKDLKLLLNSNIHTVFTDIDDTITEEGQLHADAYQALWDLKASGIRVVPVTGRPAGWCEMIARFWPVDGVIGENGGLYFRYANKEMRREFVLTEAERLESRKKLALIEAEVKKEVPNAAIASDQFSRLLDLAVDFAEDVGPLPESDIGKIVAIFEKHGAIAKVSSIHVNGWFGNYDKLSMCKTFCKKELGLDFNSENENQRITFVGDSPNDEPMFKEFKVSFAVANITQFKSQLHYFPTFRAEGNGGKGFVQITNRLISLKAN